MSKNKKTSTTLIWLFVIALLAVSIIAVVVIGMSKKEKQPAPNLIPTQPEKETVISYIEVEHEITAQIIEDGLKEIGTLETADYYFTQVINYSDSKKIWGIFNSESSFLASYDGHVTAGINMGLVKVEKDDENKTVNIYIPSATLNDVYIDHDSFVLYDEKDGFKNPISAKDFNDAQKKLEETSKEKAIAKGILTKADESAKRIIFNFVASLIDTNEYQVNVIKQ